MVNRIVNSVNINLTSISTDEPISDVPCGSCNMCCKLLSPFLTTEEIASGKYPLSIINPSNTNEGPTVVLFRNIHGGCGMLIDNKCSIYEDRPIACRQFDCRRGHHPKTNIVAKEKFGIDIQ
jgi:Fe-S-cluster containining protein